jgi:hypothetical protein
MTKILDPLDACFFTTQYLEDFPQHQKVFEMFGVAREHTINNNSKELLVQVACLEAAIELIPTGGLKDPLGLRMAGYCLPQEDFDGRFIVKIECSSGDLESLNVGTLLVMLGHLCEQTASDGLYKLGVHALRSTCFDSVYKLLLNNYGMTEDDADIRAAADIICAWSSAIFVCFATGLSVAHVAVGMAQDSLRKRLVGDFLQDYGQQLYTLTDAHRAIFSEQVLAGISGSELCKCIDRLTKSVFLSMS